MASPRQKAPTTEPGFSLAPAIAAPAALALASLGIGCASTGTPGEFFDRLTTPNEGVRAELDELEERVRRLETEASASDSENALLREQIAELEAALEEVRAVAEAPPPPAPFDPPPPARVQVVEVSDLVSDTGPFVENGAGSVAAAKDRTENGTDPLTAGSAPAEDRTDRPATGTEPAGNGRVPADGQEQYDQALQAFMEQEYVEAELAFQRFLSAFPDTDLSDNALYWIGECRFARGDDRGALAAFQQMLHDFPLGNKAPDALLKTGRALMRLGDLDGGRRRFREVLRRFPDTEAARLATDALAASADDQ